jgi:hypothetical protein
VEFVAESQPRIVLMTCGRVVDDGASKEIMTRLETLSSCSVAPPEITRLFCMLSDHGLPRDVLDVNEAFDILMRNLGEATT